MAKAKDLDALREKFQDGAYHKFPLNNVILRHPHLDKPDTKFDPGGDGKYKVACIVSSDVAADMDACGFNVKSFDDGEQYVTATRKPSLGKVEIKDDTGVVISGATIGNGSVANVTVTTKYWNVGSKPSQALYLEDITITDLVKYDGGEEGFDPF